MAETKIIPNTSSCTFTSVYITSSTLIEDVEPVISETKKITKPYIEEDVKILQNFYENTSDKKVQEEIVKKEK